MGKTIQIIALFVSDRQKPNLVVACVSFRMPFTLGADMFLQSHCCNYAMEE